ncbi:MAG: InlB B-repeat-containing protein [Lachnospiraceae bacterium]|nr:InlB B-repeat-containing protein [Lachnospiraceae bacterium]
MNKKEIVLNRKEITLNKKEITLNGKQNIFIVRKIYWMLMLFLTVSLSGNVCDSVYAAGDGRTYKIDYKLKSGKISKKAPKYYVSGKTMKLVKPTRSGYIFRGWYKDKKYKTKIKKIKKNTTGKLRIYAKWEPKIYAVKYVLNGGENSDLNPISYRFNFSKKLYSPLKRGNDFEGWYKDSKFKTKVKSIGKGTKGKVVLYSKWKEKTFTIKYKLNGGTNSKSNPTSYKYGKGTVLKNPTREGYSFEGWYLDDKFVNRIDQISPTDIDAKTLYARWTLEPLNINAYGNDNMIWNWWYYPQVVSYKNKLNRVYWGYATNEGYCGIAAYDNETKTTEKTHLKQANEVDDHNGLALTVMDDGRIMCAYAGGHNEDRDIHIRISDNPENISSFSKEVVLLSSGKTCYSQILKHKDNYYLFYRVDNKKWAYRRSRDGIIWTAEKILITADMQYYCKFVPTTVEGLVRVCMYSNPTSEDPNIRLGFLNLGNENLYNGDLKTILGKTEVDYKKFSTIIGVKPEGTQRLFDVAVTEPKKTKVLYSAFSTSKSAKDSVYKLYDSGKVYDICTGGEPLWNPKYQLGATFMDENSIVVARNENGYDYVELYNYDGSSLNLKYTVHSEVTGVSDFRNARPIVDVNGNSFLWHRGYYNPNSYTDFLTDAMIFFMNDVPKVPEETEKETDAGA